MDIEFAHPIVDDMLTDAYESDDFDANSAEWKALVDSIVEREIRPLFASNVRVAVDDYHADVETFVCDNMDETTFLFHIIAEQQ